MLYALTPNPNPNKYKINKSFTQQLIHLQQLTSLDNGEINDLIPHALAASANPNILSHAQAKKAEDWDKFICAMQEEIKQMIGNNIFEDVPFSEVPLHQQVLQAVWSHK